MRLISGSLISLALFACLTVTAVHAQGANSPATADESAFSVAVRQALAETEKGHFKEAQDILRKAATPKDPSAEYALATFLMRGMDHAQPNPQGGYLLKPDEADFTEGMTLMTHAAAHGFAIAQTALGWGYELGARLPRDFQIALGYYESAAAQGNASGRRGINRLRDGLGAWAKHKPSELEAQAEDASRALDYKSAFDLFKKAADFGSAPALYEVGVFYDQGRTVKADSAEALRWYAKAAQKSYPPAEWAMSGYGHLTTPDQASWLRKAADHRLTIAMLQLGGAMVNGAPGVAKDEPAGLKLIRQAADRDDTFAKLAIAQIYFVGRPGFLAKDQSKAVRLATEAMQDGNPAAAELLRKMNEAKQQQAK